MKLVKSVLVAMLLGIMAIQVAWAETLEELEKEAFQNKAFKEPKMLNDYLRAKRNGDVEGAKNILQKVLGKENVNVNANDNVNNKDIARERALMDAVGRNLSKVKSLVESGVNINARADYGFIVGWTALMVAAHRESYESAKYLVSKGADINAVNSSGRNALMIALMESYYASQRIAIAKHLISKGINVNVKDNQGKTALMYATERCWIDVVNLLVEKGADVNAEDDEGKTALSRGCAKEFLLSKGAKQTVCGADGINRDLFSAIANGNVSQLKVSIKLGADVNAKNSSCNTALMEAIKNSSSNRSANGLEMVKLLVENGADVNAKDRGGNTALLKAIEMKREATNTNAMRVIRCLVENGADLNAKNKKGITTLIYSASDFDLMKYFIENGAKDINSVLHYATNVEMLKYLISKGVDIKSDEGIALFLKFVANCNWTSGCDNMQAEEIQAIEFLIKNGIDVNAKNSQGTTALMIATKAKNLNLMKYLVSKGVDVNAKDNNGKTALDMAMDLKQEGSSSIFPMDLQPQGYSDIYPIIEFLLDNGAKK